MALEDTQGAKKSQKKVKNCWKRYRVLLAHYEQFLRVFAILALPLSPVKMAVQLYCYGVTPRIYDRAYDCLHSYVFSLMSNSESSE